MHTNALNIMTVDALRSRAITQGEVTGERRARRKDPLGESGAVDECSELLRSVDPP